MEDEIGCPDAISGIDLNYDDASACVLLCNYHPIYSISRVICENKGTHLEYTFPDITDIYHTKYSGTQYRVNKMSLYVPGLHTYENSTMSAELVINHLSETNDGKSLNVCIPVEGGGIKDSLLDSLIAQTLELSNSGSSGLTMLSIPDFDISMIIPNRPFYSYTGQDMFKPCIPGNNDAEFLVFDKKASIKISTSTLNNLTSNITRAVINPSSVGSHKLYYNMNGPTHTTSDEIYISCQPTGSSDETTPLYLNGSKNYILAQMLILFGSVVGIALIIFLIKFVQQYRADGLTDNADAG
jgi:hypothetical protein